MHKLPRGCLTAHSREAVSPALARQRDPIAIVHALLPIVLHHLQSIAEGALQQGDHLLAASTWTAVAGRLSNKTQNWHKARNCCQADPGMSCWRDFLP